MSDIIDFNTEKNIREHDDNTKMQMPDGKWWFKYSCDYTYETGDDGQRMPEFILKMDNVFFPKNKWSIEFWALNDEDAQKRVDAMKKTFVEPDRVMEEHS